MQEDQPERFNSLIYLHGCSHSHNNNLLHSSPSLFPITRNQQKVNQVQKMRIPARFKITKCGLSDSTSRKSMAHAGVNPLSAREGSISVLTRRFQDKVTYKINLGALDEETHAQNAEVWKNPHHQCYCLNKIKSMKVKRTKEEPANLSVLN